MTRPLVIGYGNPLRRDDGVGWHVANALAADPRAAGLEVIAAHQLTPEFAQDLSSARVAILVDARVDGAPAPAPGRWVIEHVDAPAPAGVRPAPGLGAWSHHCTPRSLAMLARDLYGSAAPVTVVGVGVRSVESGEHLTSAVASAIPSIVDTILDLAGVRDSGPSPAEGRHA